MFPFFPFSRRQLLISASRIFDRDGGDAPGDLSCSRRVNWSAETKHIPQRAERALYHFLFLLLYLSAGLTAPERNIHEKNNLGIESERFPQYYKTGKDLIFVLFRRSNSYGPRFRIRMRNGVPCATSGGVPLSNTLQWRAFRSPKKEGNDTCHQVNPSVRVL